MQTLPDNCTRYTKWITEDAFQKDRALWPTDMSTAYALAYADNPYTPKAWITLDSVQHVRRETHSNASALVSITYTVCYH